MSLNWREIDAVLAELDLGGSFVQSVVQPDFRNLYLEIFRPGRRFFLRICLETGRTRLHASDRKPAKPRTRQRFAQLLHSRVKGAHIHGARQVNCDRVVRIDLERAAETTILWIRLWGGAANCIATDEHGTILDAFYRRPAKGEVTGGTYVLEDATVDPVDDPRIARFQARWESNVNEAVRDHYRAIEADERRTKALDAARTALTKQRAALTRRLDRAGNDRGAGPAGAGADDPQRLKTIGDLIVSNLYRIAAGTTRVDLQDYTNDNAIVSVELDPQRSPQQNAERYYERAQKSRRRIETARDEEANLRQRIERIEKQIATLDDSTTQELERIAEEESRGASASRGPDGSGTGPEVPGLHFESGGFTLIVGRNARENDQLLRRHVKGNDVWLHTRDYPGAYVFVRAMRGKSVPLDVLLDAGNLAVHYSRAKSNGRADLYYTQVKHLRRAKDGPTGLVLPTQEKNLHVVVEGARLARLLGREG